MNLLKALLRGYNAGVTIKSTGIGIAQMGPGQLPSPEFPQPPRKPVAIPSPKTQIARQTSAFPRTDRNLANTDITTYRNGTDTRVIIRDLAASNPDLASTKSGYLRVGIPENYTVIGRDPDGAINRDATALAQEILRRVTFLGDTSLGYNPVTDLQSMSESLGNELMLYGSCGLELALDKQMAPTWLTAVSTTKLQWFEEEGGFYPVQVVAGVERRLDIPTFFYVSIDQDLLTPYSSSYFESAIQPVIADSTFMNQLRYAMQRSLNPRIIASIIEDKFKKSLPPDIYNDSTKYAEAAAAVISSIGQTLQNLNPEDALATFDSVQYDILDGNGMDKATSALQTVQRLLESKVAAGAKTMPAVLGRDSTSGAATTTAMLFLKNADVIRRKLNVLYSRMLTQAVRIMGQDCFVEFKYADLDLRPKGELEAYKAMEQSRILNQLSLGFITDEEACLMLTGNLTPQGYTPKSGTMFMNSTQQLVENPDSQTSTMNKDKTPEAPKD